MSKYKGYRRIVDSVIKRWSAISIQVYKYNPDTQRVRNNIYQEPRSPIYYPPVTLCSTYLNEVDKDKRTEIGRENTDEARFTVSIPELIRKFPDLAEKEWITTQDLIVAEGTKYKISGVQYYGRIGGRSDVLQIRCIEDPDTIFVGDEDGS